VSVRIGGQTGCDACDEGKGCGAGLFGKLLRRNPVELKLANVINAREGQAVRLGISESLFLRLVLRLYGWPLIAGFAGAAIAYRIATSFGSSDGMSDLATIAGACLGLAAVLIFWNRASKPEVSSSDIRLLETPGDVPACSAGTGNNRI
jgi:sigma-E factor negative regulatory protein RseC